MGDSEKTEIFGAGETDRRLQPPYLVIVDGPHKGARFPLKEAGNTIGRLEECDVVLDDQSVSRKHALLSKQEAGWTIEDQQSKNGSFVNGAKIAEPVVLGHKDFIRFGIYMLRLVTEVISPQEEMTVPPELEEVGTVMAASPQGPASKEGETAGMDLGSGEQRMTTGQTEPITSPFSDEEKKGFVPYLKKGAVKLRARVWILFAILFALFLGTALYFYWGTVLTGAQEEEEKPVAQRPSRPVAIPLGPPEPEAPKTIPVFLDCVANPFPATVYFEGKKIGNTPLKVNVDVIPQKNYEIEAQFEMTEIQDKYIDRLQFSVKPNESFVSLLFRAPVGTIKLADLPRDISIYLEAYYEHDPYTGHPVKLQNIVLNKPIYAPFGRYILELRRLKEVGETSQLIEDIVYRREFFLKEEKPVFLVEVTEESLAKFPAEIRSIPTGADVFINQKRIGETPYIGELPIGEYQLTLRKEGFFESTQTIKTDINMPFKTEITLRTSEAGEKLNKAKAFLKQGVFDGAIQELSDLFAMNPTEGEAAEAKLLLGNAYLKKGELPKALGYYEQAATYHRFTYPAKLGIARIYSLQKMTEKALIPLVDVLLHSKEEEILNEARQVFKEVSPLRSVVYIQSEPAGADVYLNDQKMGQMTPVLLHEIGLGNYRIRLEKTGFQPLELNLHLGVNEFNPVLAKLKPLP